MVHEQDRDVILCECPLEPLKTFVETQLSPRYAVQLVKAPAICLTMVRAEDSVEHQPFYLGEVLTTECEVAINGTAGYGLCVGDEPERAYCLAVVDSLIRQQAPALPEIDHFLAVQAEALRQAEREEFNHIMRTRVDFKLMKQA
jgi:alpha-D-ribose 1-methylphosphonate 5-triphosphate synthase subunit PhnG